MKVAIVFVLLFATVLCRPVKKISVSSSESSEEVVKATPVTPVTPDSADTTSASTSDTTSQDSEDSDDDDDDDETDESDEDDDSSDSSESGEASTPAPGAVTPAMVTEEPAAETTSEPIVPTIVTDTDTGRGDSLGGYPGDYKSIVYMEDKSYLKGPAPYKSYEFVGTGKKMAYDMAHGNEVEKTMTVYKALQVHSDLEEDTSTPEVENQGLDASQDQDVGLRQASLPEEESVSPSDASPSEATTSESESESESSSATEEEEEEEESASSASDSTSTESEDEESSEEATATPGAADSDSDESDSSSESDSSESDSDEEEAAPDATTDMPVVITAK